MKCIYNTCNNENQPDTRSIGKGPVQRVHVAESTWHKWFKEDVNVISRRPQWLAAMFDLGLALFSDCMQSE